MENKQQSTLKNKILKAVASVNVTFQNPPFSPGRDHKVRSHGGKGFSGPMIPDEARRKPKGGGGIETQEPTSPKVSCMGQIKHKKKQIQKAKANKNMPLPTTHNTRHGGGGDGVNSASSTPRDTEIDEIKKKHGSNKFQRMFFHAAKPKTGARKKLSDSSFVSVVGERNNKDGVLDRAPPVGQMKRFASGRETFSNFDWKAQIAPEEMDHRDCFTDDDRVESDAEEEDEVMIPFSAPILVGGGSYNGRGSGLNLQPRKEINLWKRRTMTPPKPLQLKPVLTAK